MITEDQIQAKRAIAELIERMEKENDMKKRAIIAQEIYKVVDIVINHLSGEISKLQTPEIVTPVMDSEDVLKPFIK